MVNFEYQLKPEDDWKESIWPWDTVASMNTSLIGQTVKEKFSGLALSDILELKMRVSSMVTMKNIGHWAKTNKRASEASLQMGKAKGIKELFTGPCPDCKSIGVAVPREKPECKNLPLGLWCPKCEKHFPTVSVYGLKPAFLIAAGPSLSKNINQLKRIKGHYPIFAVDTALPSMQMEGIKPDFCVTVETDPLINRMDINTEGITLLASLQVDYKFRQLWKGPVYMIDTIPTNQKDITKRIEKHGDLGWAAVGGNVSSIMFAMISGLFPSHIIFVGHDFSYPHLQNYYPAGGPMSMIPIKTIFSTHDIYGNRVFTDGSLYGYKEWTNLAILSVARNNFIKFVNATEGGILGTTYYDPKRFKKWQYKRRELQYKIMALIKNKKWPSDEEAGENGFKGKKLNCVEHMTLKEAIDKYCPLALKE